MLGGGLPEAGAEAEAVAVQEVCQGEVDGREGGGGQEGLLPGEGQQLGREGSGRER